MQELISTGLRFVNNNLEILDQQLLPHKQVWIKCLSPEHMSEIIKALKVRGAPLIGVSASLAIASYALNNKVDKVDIINKAEMLKKARPTAVNLEICLDRLLKVFKDSMYGQDKLIEEAFNIFFEDVQLCEKMALLGAELINSGDGVLTHCNSGGLATAGIGTALGVIIKAHHVAKDIHVYVDETRPLLQGGRLTTWELAKEGVPHTLICDNMAAHLMQQGKIQKIFVGADRVATNGDFANKIGTYSVAINASFHKIPLFVVAPYTTVDFACKTGRDIPIEQRCPQEVKGVSGTFGDVTWAPHKVPVFNPAFDVTPHQLVSGWIFDSGVQYDISDKNPIRS
ncbi:MAG: S-methyl-5-thioribose-1-phosphate isomerase [Bacteriovoracaceae bacterium]|nr:S-methyl-5-thioribose-1-phosphate isomerase [Bacteriovoracaceae bacterium]